MALADDVPAGYRQYFFVNAGGPSRKVVGRDTVQRKWHLVLLDCGHRLLLPDYRKTARVGCGFCGGLTPLSEQELPAASTTSPPPPVD